MIHGRYRKLGHQQGGGFAGFHDDNAGSANREIKMTDSGRTVYGGGGITPDVKIPPSKLNRFQETLLAHYVFFNFARNYTAKHTATKTFAVDDAAMQDFRKYLDDEKISYTEQQLTDNADWIKSSIKSEVFTDALGQEEGLKVRAESDPQVQKALDLIPEAKALADNAKKIIAERASARAGNQ